MERAFLRRQAIGIQGDGFNTQGRAVQEFWDGKLGLIIATSVGGERLDFVVFLRVPFRHAPHTPCVNPATRACSAFRLEGRPLLEAGDNFDPMRAIAVQKSEYPMKQFYGEKVETRDTG